MKQKVWGKEFSLLISTDERVQEENDQHKSCRHKRKVVRYPCHLDGAFEDKKEEKLLKAFI